MLQISFILTIFISAFSSCSQTQFESESWKNWEESEAEPSLRWNMTDDLMSDYELKGMSAEQIRDLLGEPEKKFENEWRYYLGLSGHGIDTGALVLTFNQDTVVDYKIWHG